MQNCKQMCLRKDRRDLDARRTVTTGTSHFLPSFESKIPSPLPGNRWCFLISSDHDPPLSGYPAWKQQNIWQSWMPIPNSYAKSQVLVPQWLLVVRVPTQSQSPSFIWEVIDFDRSNFRPPTNNLMKPAFFGGSQKCPFSLPVFNEFNGNKKPFLMVNSNYWWLNSRWDKL